MSNSAERRLYFAYGSNMDKAQMALRCPDATVIGVARLSRHRFIINNRGVASVSRVEAGATYGLLWSISETDESRLDRYEGVGKGFYRKMTLSVAVQENQAMDALVYVASSNEHGKPRAGYLERILRAAIEHRLPAASIEELKEWLE